MKRIIGLITVLLIIVCVFAYLYFSNLHGNSRNNNRILAEIPSDASLILQFQNEDDLFEILQENTLFDTITGSKQKAEMHFLREFVSKNILLNTILKGQSIFISIHPTEKDSLNYLWSIGLNSEHKKDELKKFISQYPVTKQGENEFRIIKSSSELGDNPFYFILDEGIARGSSSKNLLLRSINKSAKKIEPDFVKIINEGVKKEGNSLVNLFINHTQNILVSPFLKRKISGNFALFESFKGYSRLTLNYKKDALMFNGEISLSNKQNSYLNLFLNQAPVKNSLKDILPYNTANSISYGLSDFTNFHSELKNIFDKNKELEKLENKVKKITLETGLNPQRDIEKLWGTEFVTVQLSTFENLAIIKLKNGQQMQLFLDLLSSTYSGNIQKINYDDLFYYYWGEPLKRYVKPFYIIQDNLLILSNSAVTIQKYLKDYNTKRFLVKSDAFKQFNQYVAEESNISFLMHLTNSEGLMQDLLKKNFAESFKPGKGGIKNLYAFTYQLTSTKKKFFINLYTGYKASTPTYQSNFIVDSIKNN